MVFKWVRGLGGYEKNRMRDYLNYDFCDREENG